MPLSQKLSLKHKLNLGDSGFHYITDLVEDDDRFRTTCFTNLDRYPSEIKRSESVVSRPRPRYPVFKDTAEGRSTMDKLPQELIDKIISSIDQTSPSGYFALFACSRVSRAWRRQAQKGLFPDIRFMNVDQLRRWDRNVRLGSEISTYVRRLHWSVWPTEMDQPDPFLENSFPGRFSSFSNIEDLFVSNLSLRYFHTTAIERIFGHLSHSLRSLAISQLTTDPDKWCFLVSLFPNLRRISIFDTIMLEGGAPGLDHPHSFNFTGHIALYNHGTEKLFRCIAGLNPRFEAFEVHAVDGALVDTFNLVVRSCSATLTEISITPFIMGIEGNPDFHQGHPPLTSSGQASER